MSVVDTTLLVGSCPFRDVPGRMDDLNRLRERAELDLAVATGFRSLFYFDPVDGLERDLDEFAEASEWLRFLTVINPEFPNLEQQMERAGKDARICGCRLVPGLHRYALLSDRVRIVCSAADEAGLPVVISGRIFDDRVAPRAIGQAPVDMGELSELLQAESSTTFVLSMFFFGELKGMGADWEGLPNVYLDLGCSKPSSASFDELPTWFPVNRVVFGTGAPYYYWGGSRLALEGSTLTEDVKADILGNNALEVFSWR
jgi:predicted TIM-barrel fold metal-dependent hydrolase